MVSDDQACRAPPLACQRPFACHCLHQPSNGRAKRSESLHGEATKPHLKLSWTCCHCHSVMSVRGSADAHASGEHVSTAWTRIQVAEVSISERMHVLRHEARCLERPQGLIPGSSRKASSCTAWKIGDLVVFGGGCRMTVTAKVSLLPSRRPTKRSSTSLP